ncbi:hypothetical protein OH77DRAFT_1016310 [Trametes cingulata]|nr:hypothetical protein OH77DRAFT_1016310 [Trametes cingulata]
MRRRSTMYATARYALACHRIPSHRACERSGGWLNTGQDFLSSCASKRPVREKFWKLRTDIAGEMDRWDWASGARAPVMTTRRRAHADAAEVPVGPPGHADWPVAREPCCSQSPRAMGPAHARPLAAAGPPYLYQCKESKYWLRVAVAISTKRCHKYVCAPCKRT